MSVLYSLDGDGNWKKCEWKKQCPYINCFRKKCQGVEGHAGHHWRYSTSGSYEWDENKEELSESELNDRNRSACGMTPPDHESWISPVDKNKD